MKWSRRAALVVVGTLAAIVAATTAREVWRSSPARSGGMSRGASDSLAPAKPAAVAGTLDPPSEERRAEARRGLQIWIDSARRRASDAGGESTLTAGDLKRIDASVRLGVKLAGPLDDTLRAELVAALRADLDTGSPPDRFASLLVLSELLDVEPATELARLTLADPDANVTQLAIHLLARDRRSLPEIETLLGQLEARRVGERPISAKIIERTIAALLAPHETGAAFEFARERLGLERAIALLPHWPVRQSIRRLLHELAGSPDARTRALAIGVFTALLPRGNSSDEAPRLPRTEDVELLLSALHDPDATVRADAWSSLLEFVETDLEISEDRARGALRSIESHGAPESARGPLRILAPLPGLEVAARLAALVDTASPGARRTLLATILRSLDRGVLTRTERARARELLAPLASRLALEDEPELIRLVELFAAYSPETPLLEGAIVRLLDAARGRPFAEPRADRIRSAPARAAASLRVSRAGPSLLALAQDPQPSGWVLRAFAPLPELASRSVPVLSRIALRSSWRDPRAFAIETLLHLGAHASDAAPSLLESLDRDLSASADEHLVILTVRALAATGDERVYRSLAARLDESLRNLVSSKRAGSSVSDENLSRALVDALAALRGRLERAGSPTVSLASLRPSAAESRGSTPWRHRVHAAIATEDVDASLVPDLRVRVEEIVLGHEVHAGFREDLVLRGLSALPEETDATDVRRLAELHRRRERTLWFSREKRRIPRTIGDLGSEDAVRQLIDLEADASLSAWDALSIAGSVASRACDLAIERLATAEPAVRVSTARFLGERAIHADRCVPALAARLAGEGRDPLASVRAALALAIGRFREEGRPAMTALLEATADTSWRVRFESARAIRRVGAVGDRVREHVRKRVEMEEDPRVRSALERVLASGSELPQAREEATR